MQSKEQLLPDLPCYLRDATEIIAMIEKGRFSNSPELLEIVLTSLICYLEKKMQNKERELMEAQHLKEKAENLLEKNIVGIGTKG